uniref:ATP synthase F0 subunit 8 n=1 Tax=Kapsa arca TaxID=3003636 RepID=A0A9E9EML5_9HEMI|nr:ATP synthase F0 subunit 8 [Kapsa arca]WAM61627.1 ATP synthase F0 subunit 8 [Kapsa arca]
MPQMSPMWWTLLMIMFIIALFIMMTMIFFNLFIDTKITLMKIKSKTSIWKW